MCSLRMGSLVAPISLAKTGCSAAIYLVMLMSRPMNKRTSPSNRYLS